MPFEKLPDTVEAAKTEADAVVLQLCAEFDGRADALTRFREKRLALDQTLAQLTHLSGGRVRHAFLAWKNDIVTSTADFGDPVATGEAKILRIERKDFPHL